MVIEHEQEIIGVLLILFWFLSYLPFNQFSYGTCNDGNEWKIPSLNGILRSGEKEFKANTTDPVRLEKFQPTRNLKLTEIWKQSFKPDQKLFYRNNRSF